MQRLTREELDEAMGSDWREKERAISELWSRREARRLERERRREIAERASEDVRVARERVGSRVKRMNRVETAVAYANILLDRLSDDRWPTALICDRFLSEVREITGHDYLSMMSQNRALGSSLSRFRKKQLMVDGRRVYVYVLPPASEQLLHISKTAPRGFGLRERAREILITRHGVDPGPADDTPAS